MSEHREPGHPRRLAALVHGRPEAIIAGDRRAAIVYANPAAERLTGYPAGGLVGQSLSRLVEPAQRPRVDALAARAIGGSPCSVVQVVLVTRQGSSVPVALSVSAITEADGSVTGVSAIVRPVERGGADEDSGEAERNRRFLADAAHQLVTPITGIRACADTLMRGIPEEQQEGLVARMVREAARAADLLTALLRIAQLDDGQALTMVPCDIVALCGDEADRVWTLAPELDMALSVGQLPEPLPLLDADAVREILANLLDNARRHAVDSVRVDVTADGDRLRIQVSDDGPGVPREDWERVFERFVSLDRHKGSGLGLAIARGLARAHGGELSCNREGFLLELPIRPR